jgi:hypothetical protein
VTDVIAFAYGSNMLSRRLQARVPSARSLAVGLLERHRLEWHKRGRDGSAKCDAAYTGRADDQVWGVLFALSANDKRVLDEIEGLHAGYEDKRVEIATGQSSVTAQMYFATDIDPLLKPFHWYKAFVVGGAREHGLPRDYVAALEAALSVPDPDEARNGRNMRILGSAA